MGTIKKIAVIGFQPTADIVEGLTKLIDKYPEATVYIPVEDMDHFTRSVIDTVRAKGSNYKPFVATSSDTDNAFVGEDFVICTNPLKEIMRMLNSDDVLALVWDDSVEAHMVLHSLEDFGMETWDIMDGLNPIEVTFHEDETTDDLYETMVQTLDLFAESLAAYVTSAVLDVLTETLRHRMDEDEGSRDIDL